MRTRPHHLAVGALVAAAASAAVAGTEPYFTPLTQSSAVASPNHVNELNSPWQAPAGIAQTNLLSLRGVEADVLQSTQRVPGLGTGASMFDMLAYDPSGRYVFIPHETSVGAGISRYDTETGTTELLFAGNQQGPADWSNDFGAFDPARFTPNGTIIAAEEWSGEGRVVEYLDPLGAAPMDPTAGGSSLVEGQDWRVLTSIARVSHEGINFSVQNPERVIYFVDEDNSGSIYKLVLERPGDYVLGGQTFVLAVDGFTGDPARRWDRAPNDDPAVSASRFGEATWVPLTDEDGNVLPGIRSPFTGAGRPGRDAADDAGGTPYGRPEDMTIGSLRNGNEVLYVAITSENAMLSVEELGGGKAMVREFVSETGTPKNVGFLPTTGRLNSPDNLAQDALGNVYIVEDAPNGSDVGGDVWFARDADNDGVAESLDHFLSIQVDGAEATGMIFNPQQPHLFVISVQHPDSTDLTQVANGHGDAVWQFDVAGAVPPVCDDVDGVRGRGQSWGRGRDGRDFRGGYGRGPGVRTCSETNDANFLRMLQHAERRASDLAP